MLKLVHICKQKVLMTDSKCTVKRVQELHQNKTEQL